MTTFVGQMPALSDLIYPLKTPLVTEEAVWPEEHLPIGPTSVGLIAVGFGGGQVSIPSKQVFIYNRLHSLTPFRARKALIWAQLQSSVVDFLRN